MTMIAHKLLVHHVPTVIILIATPEHFDHIKQTSINNLCKFDSDTK